MILLCNKLLIMSRRHLLKSSQFIYKTSCLHFKQFRVTSKITSPHQDNQAGQVVKENRGQQSNKPNGFITIYKFPKIVHLKTISRLKIYQTIFMVSLVPMLPTLYQNNIVSSTVLTGLCGLAAFSLCSLYFMSSWFRRFVGFIYLSDDNKKVKISHLNFWGNRRDVIVPIEDIVLLPDTIDFNPEDVYSTIRRHDTKDKYYFTLKYGEMTDPELFREAFGYPDHKNLDMFKDIFDTKNDDTNTKEEK